MSKPEIKENLNATEKNCGFKKYKSYSNLSHQNFGNTNIEI